MQREIEADAVPERLALLDWIRRPRAGSLADATLNACFNALDRHVIRGHGDQPALVYDGPRSGPRVVLTYAQLLEQAAAFGGALRAWGVQAGDRVLLVPPTAPPTGPEPVVAMLACARIGAVHVGVGGHHDAAALGVLLTEHRPVVVVTPARDGEADQKSRLDEALGTAGHEPVAVVVTGATGSTAMHEPRDVVWELARRAGASEPAGCSTVPATAPLLVVTGPEGVPTTRDTGRDLAEMAWTASRDLGLRPGQEAGPPDDLGSEAGLVAGVYGPLLVGATVTLTAPHD